MRNKGFSAINITGLAIGIAVFILIGLYVRHELTVDRFHEKLDHIYRLQSEEWVTTPAPTADQLSGQFPEVREIVRFNLNMHPTIVHGEQRYRISNMVLADPGVFKIFSFNLIQGNPEMVLTEPMSLVFHSRWQKRSSEMPNRSVIRFYTIISIRLLLQALWKISPRIPVSP